MELKNYNIPCYCCVVFMYMLKPSHVVLERAQQALLNAKVQGIDSNSLLSLSIFGSTTCITSFEGSVHV